MTEIAGGITNHLHFDMARAAEKLLDIEIGVTEGGSGFGLAAGECGRQFALTTHKTQAAPAAASVCLDQHLPPRSERAQERCGLLDRHRIERAQQYRDIE